jgi:hypothetical protein
MWRIHRLVGWDCQYQSVWTVVTAETVLTVLVTGSLKTVRKSFDEIYNFIKCAGAGIRIRNGNVSRYCTTGSDCSFANLGLGRYQLRDTSKTVRLLRMEFTLHTRFLWTWWCIVWNCLIGRIDKLFNMASHLASWRRELPASSHRDLCTR